MIFFSAVVSLRSVQLAGMSKRVDRVAECARVVRGCIARVIRCCR